MCKYVYRHLSIFVNYRLVANVFINYPDTEKDIVREKGIIVITIIVQIRGERENN